MKGLCRVCSAAAGRVSTLCDECVVQMWRRNQPDAADSQLARERIRRDPRLLARISQLNREQH